MEEGLETFLGDQYDDSEVVTDGFTLNTECSKDVLKNAFLERPRSFTVELLSAAYLAEAKEFVVRPRSTKQVVYENLTGAHRGVSFEVSFDGRALSVEELESLEEHFLKPEGTPGFYLSVAFHKIWALGLRKFQMESWDKAGLRRLTITPKSNKLTHHKAPSKPPGWTTRLRFWEQHHYWDESKKKLSEGYIRDSRDEVAWLHESRLGTPVEIRSEHKDMAFTPMPTSEDVIWQYYLENPKVPLGLGQEPTPSPYDFSLRFLLVRDSHHDLRLFHHGAHLYTRAALNPLKIPGLTILIHCEHLKRDPSYMYPVENKDLENLLHKISEIFKECLNNALSEPDSALRHQILRTPEALRLPLLLDCPLIALSNGEKLTCRELNKASQGEELLGYLPLMSKEDSALVQEVFPQNFRLRCASGYPVPTSLRLHQKLPLMATHFEAGELLVWDLEQRKILHRSFQKLGCTLHWHPSRARLFALQFLSLTVHDLDMGSVETLELTQAVDSFLAFDEESLLCLSRAIPLTLDFESDDSPQYQASFSRLNLDSMEFEELFTITSSANSLVSLSKCQRYSLARQVGWVGEGEWYLIDLVAQTQNCQFPASAKVAIDRDGEQVNIWDGERVTVVSLAAGEEIRRQTLTIESLPREVSPEWAWAFALIDAGRDCWDTFGWRDRMLCLSDLSYPRLVDLSNLEPAWEFGPIQASVTAQRLQWQGLVGVFSLGPEDQPTRFPNAQLYGDIIVQHENGKHWVLNPQTAEQLFQLPAKPIPASSLAVSPTLSCLLLENESAVVVDTETGELRQTLESPFNRASTELLALDERSLGEGHVALRSSPKATTIGRAASLHPTEPLALGERKESVTLIRPAQSLWKTKNFPGQHACFSPRGKYFLLENRGTIELYLTKTLERIATISTRFRATHLGQPSHWRWLTEKCLQIEEHLWRPHPEQGWSEPHSLATRVPPSLCSNGTSPLGIATKLELFEFYDLRSAEFLGHLQPLGRDWFFCDSDGFYDGTEEAFQRLVSPPDPKKRRPGCLAQMFQDVTSDEVV